MMPSYPEQDTRELRRAWHTLVRSLPWILLITLAVSLLTFLFFRQQPLQYAASVKLLAGISNNSPLNVTVITPPPLPPHALENALTNPTVLRQIVTEVQRFTQVTAQEKRLTIERLRSSSALQNALDLTLSTNIDGNGNGTYVLEADKQNPVLASQLANAAADALLTWDAQRALSTVAETRRSLEGQVRDLRARLSAPNGSVTDRQSLQTLLSERQGQLDTVRLLVTSGAVQGTLSILTPAVAPVSPVAPLPKRNAALAALLTFFFGVAFVLIRSSLVRSLSTDEDIGLLGVPVLGRIPRVRARRPGEEVLELLHGEPANAAVYLQINLDLVLSDRPRRVILVTSSTSGEGKTSVAVALATSFALSGRRTLLLDVDPQISRHVGPRAVLNLIGSALNSRGPRKNTLEINSSIEPGNFDTLPLPIRNVPAGPKLEDVLTRLASGYDVVLIDSSPVLEVADALRLSNFIDGVLLVVQDGKIAQRTFQGVQDILRRANAFVLGAVVNKSKTAVATVASPAQLRHSSRPRHSSSSLRSSVGRVESGRQTPEGEW